MLAGVIGVLWRQNQKLWADRLADLRAIQTAYQESAMESIQLLTEIREAIETRNRGRR